MEDSINRLNDWHWGPLEFLRPPKDVNIGLGRFILVCLIAVPLEMVLLVVSLTLVNFYLAHPSIHRLPTLLQYEAAAGAMWKEAWGLIAAGGVMFPICWWPSVFCWNRRAARLRVPSAPVPYSLQEGVWPPAPKRV